MNLLIAGLALWILAHFFKRLAPGLRTGMDSTLGVMGGKAVMGALLVAAMVMMINGFRIAPVEIVFEPPVWGKYLNSLLMIEAVALMGLGKSKGRARTWVRHPMLWGVVVWSVAHLLVNGDLASLILFGGLGVWALVSMPLINMQDGAWDKPEPGPLSRDIRWLVISAVMFIVIAGLHFWIGPAPFGG